MFKNKKLLKVITFLISSMFLLQWAFSHSWRTDSSWWHNDRINWGYHYHNWWGSSTWSWTYRYKTTEEKKEIGQASCNLNYPWTIFILEKNQCVCENWENYDLKRKYCGKSLKDKKEDGQASCSSKYPWTIFLLEKNQCVCENWEYYNPKRKSCNVSLKDKKEDGQASCNSKYPWTIYFLEKNSCVCENWRSYDLKRKSCELKIKEKNKKLPSLLTKSVKVKIDKLISTDTKKSENILKKITLLKNSKNKGSKVYSILEEIEIYIIEKNKNK